VHIRRASIPFIAAVSLFGQTTSNKSAPLRVLASNGTKAVILDLQPPAERALARPLAIDFGSATGLPARINAGAPFDVASSR
jgi:ABC-type molybdate transport system substrate-binding protein